MFPGTMSVIIFGYIGGWLVDRKGSLYVLTIGIALMSSSFLIAAFFIDAAPWLMTVIIVFVFGGALLHKNGYIYNCVWQFETKGSRRRNESA
ncbi:hypothetical protein C7M20_02532 [Bacillus velezensis]|nr:hypothetical protein C7M19_00814 [Bacillus velezensis]QHK11406.1 hypothetical protein C7M20_02532 [Bacillus velezensis]